MNHSDLKVTETFVVLEDLPVKVQCFGKNLTENPKDLILLIPGNPGGVYFYSEFCEILYELIKEEYNKEISIWVLGYAGIHPSPTEGIPNLSGNEFAYSLDGQIQQKKQFVDEYIPKSCNLFIVGHSIGVKMALETFKHIKNSPSNKDIHVKYLYGLFPVIERIMETPAGPMHSKMFTDFRYLILGLIYLLSFLPIFIQIIITSLLIPKESSKKIVSAAKNLIDYKIVEKILYLGESEIQNLKELQISDLDFIRDNSPIIRFYYGKSDMWCPLKYCFDLKLKINDVQAYICRKEIPHAFTMGREVDMAQLIFKWMKEVL